VALNSSLNQFLVDAPAPAVPVIKEPHHMVPQHFAKEFNADLWDFQY
jgi:hypothetical protein